MVVGLRPGKQPAKSVTAARATMALSDRVVTVGPYFMKTEAQQAEADLPEMCAGHMANFSYFHSILQGLHTPKPVRTFKTWGYFGSTW